MGSRMPLHACCLCLPHAPLPAKETSVLNACLLRLPCLRCEFCALEASIGHTESANFLGT